MKEVNITFVAGQGLKTLVGEQMKNLNKLKKNLLQIIGGRRMIARDSDEENNFVKQDYVVRKQDAVAMIKDFGSSIRIYSKIYLQLSRRKYGKIFRTLFYL